MLLLYSVAETPRLRYMADFLSRELFDEPITLTTDALYFRQHDGPKLNYSQAPVALVEFWLSPVPLLFEQGISAQALQFFEMQGLKAFFQTGGDFPFDLLAASFYLLSRYEEYLPHEPDSYGRFSHRSSVAYREGFLQQPLVNLWIAEFKKALLLRFPTVLFARQAFTCQLTYDIDMAYAYRHKGWAVTAGGLLKSTVLGRWAEAVTRWRVITGNEKDPFDCFEWLDALHLYCRMKPVYFFLVARRRSVYDKNNSPSSNKFCSLIEYYARHYETGLHPSWRSEDEPGLLQEEREWLEVITEKPVTLSRQHYLRFSLPNTFRRLIGAGIRKDFSMGYGSINGFRASVASSFYWYDLQREAATSLQLYPFCFMDANAHFELRYTPGQAYQELMQLYESVKKVQGLFISVWHNNLLGTDPRFSGWREMFELFMRETVYWDAYCDAG